MKENPSVKERLVIGVLALILLGLGFAVGFMVQQSHVNYLQNQILDYKYGVEPTEEIH